MLFYHRNTALEPIAEPCGSAFVSRAYVLEEDGEKTSLGAFGIFSDHHLAISFAVKCATAFVDGEPMPKALARDYRADGSKTPASDTA